jgi:outer membrane usher protein
MVRLNWGAISNDYGTAAGAAIYRRGITRKFTVEGSIEGASGSMAEGAGGVLQIGNLGVVNFAAVASSGSSGVGAQYSAGAQRIGRVFSLGASTTIANRNYRDIASLNGAGVQRKQLNAFTSLALKRLGTVGAAYTEVAQDPASLPLGIVAAQHSRVVTANYSRQIHHMSIYAIEFRNFTSSGSNSGMQVGLTIPLGKRSSANVSGSSDESGQIQVQQSAPQIGDWGYQAYISAGNSIHEFAQAQYKSRIGLYTAGVDINDGATTVRLESLGALSFVDHGLFPSNQIYDSFAIVDTNPIPHVRVLQENRLAGRTNSKGRLLVPDMRAFELNHIAIEPNDIPADVTMDLSTREIRPQDRSGVVVKFPIQFSHAALLKLVDEAGLPISLGSTATLRATGAIAPIGYDGDVYIENLSAHNELTVVRSDGRSCTAAFDYKPLPGDIPSIGPLRCQEKKP